ncbi:biotin/lipoyl-containing protein [Parasphaerochaeta coccoides]|uniref:Pyruvate carboxylase n=1 Tax=Parasphaerochaeta coccoides (strain ATCC BAA-1237 / DSM 17374 / SPN1) TaxID=760011 RepID=F4GM43_PARC1|nr:biotin/lipoyl-containing protein [Parasphaerochaeta coccoides]AEC02518.1 Pyruvate carboxylase [Parasphaerochaeta coccoides DSM 17374]
MKKKVKFMCTAFRDGFQSVYGARVFTKDFMPAVAAAREAGITHFEAGGGARFQALYFYSNEDAFAMMDEFRATAGPNSDLQTLSRGVNVVGLDSQPRDIIKLHADLFKKHGMSTIRNFDALNDVNNLVDSGRYINEAGLRHEVTVTMMSLPPGTTGAHDPDFYEGVLRKILDAGIKFQSVCFKDASGTSVPAIVHETIKRARKLLGKDMNIVFHSHDTAGVCINQYINALDAGADQVDLSLSPVSGGTCQPDIITMWHALRNTDYDLGIDIKKIQEAERVFEDCMKDYFTPPEATTVNPNIPFFPLPGGALTANTQMLRDNGLMDRYPEIVEAMGETVAKGGFGTSVTPVSQFYFQQAFNNVMFGPWKKIAEGYGKMVLGYFGKTPVAPDPEVVKIAAEQMKLEPTTKKVVDINDADPKKGRKAAIDALKNAGVPETEENIFIAASCKEKGILFLTGKSKANGIRKTDPAEETAKKNGEYTVTVNGTAYGVKIGKDGVEVNGKTYPLDVAYGIDAAAIAAAVSAPVVDAPAVVPSPAVSAGVTVTGGSEVKAPMPGLVLRVEVKPGQQVKKNQLILVMEAMKMENEIFSPVDGIITSIPVAVGQQLNTDDVLATIGGTASATPAAAPSPAPVASAPVPVSEAVVVPASVVPVNVTGGTPVKAPMPGLVLRIEVKPGQKVKKNQLILVMEAMKMENEIFSPAEGTVASIAVSAGQQLGTDDLLVVIA